MIRFIENIIFILSIAAMVTFGASVYYFRSHGVENDVTTSAWVLGLAMIPVSFFVQKT